MTTSSEIIARYLFNNIQELHSTVTNQCRRFLGFERSVVEAFFKIDNSLTDRIPLIRLDPYYYSVKTTLNPELMLKESETWTSFRHIFKGATLLFTWKDTEKDSLEQVNTLTPIDLRSYTELLNLILLVPDFNQLDTNEESGIKEVVRCLADNNEVLSLREILEFVIRTVNLRMDGATLSNALGLALPELDSISYIDAFKSVKWGNLGNKSALKKSIRDFVFRNRHFANKENKSGLPISSDELRLCIDDAEDRELIPEESLTILRDFVDGSIKDEHSKKAMQALDWENDGVQWLFKRQSKRTTKLGEATKQFLTIDEGLSLENSEDTLLEQIDASKDLTDSLHEEALAFYNKYRINLQRKKLLDNRWRKLLYKKEIVESDFIFAVLRAVFAFDKEELADTSKSIQIRCDLKSVGKILESINYAAVEYFFTRYKGLDVLLKGIIDIDFGPLGDVFQMIQDSDDNQEIAVELADKYEDFASSERLAKNKNKIPFSICLVDERGSLVEGSVKLFSWQFEPKSFHIGLRKDCQMHLAHPLRLYRRSRTISSSKGGRPPISLQNPECIEKWSNSLGELVVMDDDAQDGSRNSVCLKTRINKGIDNLVSQTVIDSGTANELKLLAQQFEDQYKKALQSFLKEGLAWAEWVSFAQGLDDIFSSLISYCKGNLYGRTVLRYFALAGVVEIDEADICIVSPIHPIRLLSIYAKTSQITEAIRTYLAPDTDYIDQDVFLDTLEQDLAHPYYPEFLPWSDETRNDEQGLRIWSSQFGDYSIFSPPRATFLEKACDPTPAIKVLNGVLKDFITLHPFEKNNLSLLAHSVVSEQFPVLLSREMQKETDENLAGTRLRLYLQDNDPARLRANYRLFLKTLCDDSQEIDNGENSFLAQLGVSTLGEASSVERGDFDIAFLYDFIAERTRIKWSQVAPCSSQEPTIDQHFPARYSRRRCHDPANQSSSSYLCCPTNPSLVKNFNWMVQKSIDSGEPVGLPCLPIRDADFNDPVINKTLRETHRLAHWVVNYDSVINPRQLSAFNINVIRYRPNLAFEQNLIISSDQESDLLVVKQHLGSRLDDFSLTLKSEQRKDLIETILKKSYGISGELVLRAVARGRLVNELLGAVFTQHMYNKSVDATVRDRLIWLYLDDFAQWFMNEKALSGDFERSEDRRMADLLCFIPEQRDNSLFFRIAVLEAKVIGSAGNLDATTKKANEQVESTLNKLIDIFSETRYEDQSLWRLRLGNLLVEGGQRFAGAEDVFNPETIRDLLKDGGVPFELSGHSFVFCYGDEGNDEVLQINENIQQTVLYKSTVRKVAESFVTGTLSVDLPKPADFRSLPAQEQELEQDSYATVPLETVPADKPELKAAEAGNVAEGDYFKPIESKSSVTPESDAKTPSVAALIVPPSEISKTIEQHDCFPQLALKPLIDELIRNVDSAETEFGQVQRELESRLKKFLPSKGITADLYDFRVTPNSYRIKLRGQVNLNAGKLMQMRDEFLSVCCFDLQMAEAIPGGFLLVFARPERKTLQLPELWKTRSLINYDMGNTNILIGLDEETGESFYHDIAVDEPHLLIGGSTGSGKSVFLNSLILDLMLTNTPETLQLILADPKIVEFTLFSSSPFLKNNPILQEIPELANDPVIQSHEIATNVLKRLIVEMDERYKSFKAEKVQKLSDFNKSVSPDERLPRIVFIMDEFADWMEIKEFKTESDSLFKRLGCKGRAAGIHLILCTQRPSCDVVSPTLRANLGGKICLKVDNKANSEIILAQGGGEFLLGLGPGLAKLKGKKFVFQSPFLSSEELSSIIEALSGLALL